MSRAIFHRVHSLVLILALAFGQVGVGFFHNKHDAHETVIDPDQTVLVKHGEHCKVCAVDWIHAFLAADPDIEFPDEQRVVFFVLHVIESPDSIVVYGDGRAPPAKA
jgi:hypothetical protein